MTKANDDFDVLNDLQDLAPNTRNAEKKKREPASFRSERMEERILYSATWMDADVGEQPEEEAKIGDVSKGDDEASLAGDERTSDLFANTIVLEGSDSNDIFTFTKAQDGDAYQVQGNGGHDSLDLSGYSADQVRFDQGRLEVKLEDGGSFSVEYQGVERLSLEQQTHVAIDGVSFGGTEKDVDTIAVHVGGQHFDGAPKMNIVVDGQTVVKGFSVESDQRVGEMEDVFVYGKFGDNGPDNVKVEFTNDKWNPNVGDRNLVVDHIEVNGEKFETENAEYLKTNGDYLREGRDVMSWAGALSFDVEQPNEIVGTDKNEVLRGSTADDVIIGGEGNDRLFGNEGNDTFVYTEGDGVDRFNGGSGTDAVDASGAKDFTVQHMTKGDSIEQVTGGEAGTRIVGTSGRNQLDFTNTKLTNISEIDAGAGNDYVKGSQADDVIIGGKGNDRLFGNEGNDTFVYTEGDGVDRFNGGSGTDTVDASGAKDFTVQHMTKGDSIEQVTGGEAGTRIVGTSGRNHLDFTNTKLTNISEIDAGAGNDYVKGSQADDVIIGGKGNDRLFGNEGNDTFVYTEGDGVDRFNGGSGTDTVDASGAKDFTVQHMTKGDSIEQVTGDEAGTRIVGTSGRNHLDFTNTKLTNISEIDAGAGNDYVKGSQADDVIIGGEGNDRLFGNEGNDTFVYTEGDGVDRFNGGSGTDTVDASGAKDFTVQHMTKGDSIEQVTGGEAGTRIVGTSGRNHLDFTNTKLTNISEIDAGAGNDYVKGSQADDVIIAGQGNDRILGNGGNDEVKFSGEYEDYKITKLRNGSFRVEDLRDGSPDGIDTITDVENFRFTDGTAKVGESVIFTHESLSFSGEIIAENSAGGKFVGIFDSGRSENFYEIVDSEGNSITDSNFIIRDSAIYVAEGADLNYEENQSFELTIRSTNSGGESHTTTVEIHLSDVNEAPVAENDKDVSMFRMTETFDDGNFDGWKPISLGNSSYRWDVNDDGEVTEKSNAGRGFLGFDVGEANSPAANSNAYNVSVDVNANSGSTYNNGVGIVFGYEDSDNYYRVSWNDYSDNYSANAGHKDFTLIKVENGKATELDKVDQADLPSEFNLNVIVTEAEGIQVQVDGETLLEFSSESPAVKTLGLYTADNDRGVSYDNVSFNAMSELVTNEDAPLKISSSGLLANDVDEDGDAIKLEKVHDAKNGTVELHDDGTIVFTPAENFSGTASFSYTASTPDGQSTTADVFVQVNPQNDAVEGIKISTEPISEFAKPGTVIAKLNAIDVDEDDHHKFELVDAKGQAIDSKNFEIIGSEVRIKDGANLDFESQRYHQLSVRAYDAAGTSSIESFKVEIVNENEGQIVNGEWIEVDEDGYAEGNLLVNDKDIDGDKLAISRYSQPKNGSVVVDTNGDFIYTPDPNFSGADFFKYEVHDGKGISTSALVAIDVDPVADGVTLEISKTGGNEDRPISFDIKAVLNDESEHVSKIVVRGVPEFVRLSAGVDNGDGSWTLLPSEIDGLQLKMTGLGNPDFQLEVEVTSLDGDAVDVQSTKVTVDVENETFEAAIALTVKERADQKAQDDETPGQSPDPTMVFENDSRFDGSNSGFGRLDVDRFDEELKVDIWNTSELTDPNVFDPTFDDSSEMKFESQEPDAGFPIVELEDLGLLPPIQLKSSEPLVLEQDDLRKMEFEITGLDNGKGTAKMTMASLLMFVTAKEDDRRKLKKVAKK